MENDSAVLSSAESMSNGGIWDKIRAINSLIDNFNRLPRVKSEDLLIKLAKRDQPTDVRFHIAVKLLKGTHLDENTHAILVDTLWNG
jgi:hypothetical protein